MQRRIRHGARPSARIPRSSQVTLKPSAVPSAAVAASSRGSVTGLDDRVGRALQGAGTLALLVPDAAVFAVAFGLTKNKVVATKVTAAVSAAGLSAIAVGSILTNLD